MICALSPSLSLSLPPPPVSPSPPLPLSLTQVDFEGELGVLIGTHCKDVTAREALSYVAGYCVANDVSGRKSQFDLFNGGQWLRSKSFDSFLPLSNELIPASRVPNPQALGITTHVNDMLMQDSSTNDMVFPVADLIAFLSHDATLAPGTLILTGTPAGVGHSRNPPQYLKTGDVVRVTIEGVGTVSNPVL